MSGIEAKLNHAFDVPTEKIEELLQAKITAGFAGYDRVIPLRDMCAIDNITYFKADVFEKLIRKIPLRGTSIFPYEDSRIKIFNRDGEGLEVGQTFVLKDKLLSIMRAFSRESLFGGFVANGLSKMTPAQVYGRDKNGQKAVAFYVPSIVEIHKDSAILLDGIHRTTICSAGGTTTKAVHIQYVGAQLPFDPIDWAKVHMVNEKPPVAERYVNLRRELFRDLSAVGIDG